MVTVTVTDHCRPGEPGGQTVSQAWSVGWDSFLASSLGYVLVRLDVSGRGYSGDKCRKSVYRRLGELETRDLGQVIRSVTSTQGSLDEFQYENIVNSCNPSRDNIIWRIH